MTLSKTKLAYLAGLIDGEGSLECQKQKQPRGRTPRFVFRLAFVFVTKEPIATICEWVGAHWKMYPASSPNRSPCYRAHFKNKIAIPLLRATLPYLLLKKEQATLILKIEAVRQKYTPTRKHFGTAHMAAMPKVAIRMMDSLHKRLRALKSNKRRMTSRT